MMSDVLIRALSDHGPWALMVFFLLYRDLQKDQATRAVLDKNTQILVEMTTMIRERLPRGGRI
ncbi:hypothetical protein [Celeribacter halophilus]|uniref:Uncharacterized protein n=1 Tax=Celeribacter halophilus TaxID=576117 RepID=A0A1I3NX80_9RHOB|nr:hypothetical protein [Celeribacter halophilus]PZX14675.1 hypothetical protein LX82_00465 [Celeribacter halophilus]SFJ13829.1 hypothetical protein SAMN04488138_102114 [Celeribacter halophilus]